MATALAGGGAVRLAELLGYETPDASPGIRPRKRHSDDIVLGIQAPRMELVEAVGQPVKDAEHRRVGFVFATCNLPVSTRGLSLLVEAWRYSISISLFRAGRFRWIPSSASRSSSFSDLFHEQFVICVRIIVIQVDSGPKSSRLKLLAIPEE